MPTLALLSPALVAACVSTPLLRSAPQGGDPFPVPREGLSIEIGSKDQTSLAVLLDEFSRVTGQNLLVAKDLRDSLQASTTGLNRSVKIPPEEVYPFVEAILVQNDLFLGLLSEREPRLLAVESLSRQRRQPVRSSATFVDVAEIQRWARHPAFLVTTTLDMPHTDVRTLSNSMRVMFSDANTQQIIPVGNSNSLIVTGFGSDVSRIAATLQAIDERERQAAERKPKAEEKAPEK